MVRHVPPLRGLAFCHCPYPPFPRWVPSFEQAKMAELKLNRLSTEPDEI
jgi:hypothetical protein